jgi:CubicO group peptidase (beta-lactamase class C family)
MRRILCLSLALVSPWLANGQSKVEPLIPKLNQIIEKGMKDWEVPGCAIGIVENDKIVYLKGFGVKEVGGSDPITPRTVFPLASVSKAFCAATIGLMVDDGKMHWDDPVRRHISGFALRDPLANEMVTIRDLLNHMTGVPRHDELWYHSTNTQKDILDKIPRLSYTAPIRSRNQYNNVMYMAAGVAAGNANGTSWERLVTERIFQPLGMKDTGPYAINYLKAPDKATPHDKSDHLKIIPTAFLVADNIAPAGGINSNAQDMCQWMRLLLNNGTYEGKQIIKEATLKETMRPQVMFGRPSGGILNMFSNLISYSMGWAEKDLGGQMVVEHNGRLNGFSTSVTLLPKLKIGIVMLANNESSMPYVIPTALINAILGRPEVPYFEFIKWFNPLTWDAKTSQLRQEREFFEKAVKGTRPAQKLEGYVGKYTDGVYGSVAISQDKAGLRMKWGWKDIALSHLHYETFYGRFADGNPDCTYLQTVTFHYNNKGEIVSLNLGGLDEDEFTAVRFVKEKE